VTQTSFKPPWLLVNVTGLLDWARAVYTANKLLFDGKINTVGAVTLTTDSTTTTITDTRISINSFIQLMATNDNAAGETNMKFTTAEGSVTLTHMSDPRTRTFRYVILG